MEITMFADIVLITFSFLLPPIEIKLLDGDVSVPLNFENRKINFYPPPPPPFVGPTHQIMIIADF